MNLSMLTLGFLYFPEDKSQYGPAIIEFAIMIVICFAVFFLFKKLNKKQELKTKDLEERILKERQAKMKENH